MNDKLNMAMVEFANEISKIEISAGELLQKKVPEQTLKTELYLNEFYGDKIKFDQANQTDFSEKKKTIKKISLDDIGTNAELKQICEYLRNSKFDDDLDNFLR